MRPTLKNLILPAAIALAASALNAQAPAEITTGLSGPQRLILTPRGNILVSETSTTPNSGKVTFVTRGGQKATLLDNMPSGVEITGGGSGPTGLALRGKTLYVAQGAGDSERRGTRPGSMIWNNEGISSPIHSSILVFEFSKDIDDAQGPFLMTTELQNRLAGFHEVVIRDAAGNTATVNVLADFQDLRPDPNTIFRGHNPWSLALTDDGNTLWVTDASQNTLVKVDTKNGRWQRAFFFPPFPNPTPVGPPMIDSVPTGLRVFEGRPVVSFLSGFPFPPGTARVVEIDTKASSVVPQINGLTSVTDVLIVRNRRNIEEWYVLEFSRNQSATPPPPGRLLMFDSPIGREIVPLLITPVSMAYDEKTNSLLIAELRGRIVEVRLP